MAGPTFEHDPQQKLNYTIDWSTNFAGEGSPTPSITTSSWIVPDGLTNVSEANTSDTATVVISGGTVGTVYELINHIIRDDVLEDDRSIFLYVRQLPSVTYSKQPASSTRDQVRFLVRDTDTANAFLLDSEIDWLLTEEPNIYLAAAGAARHIAHKFTGLADRQIGDLRISHRNQSMEFSALASTLEMRGNIRAATPYLGGISISDKETQREDDDRVKPRFTRGQYDRDGRRDEDDTKLFNE